MKKNFWWYVKQLFPLRYASYYHIKDGDLIRSTWKMWFGNIYNVQTAKVPECYDYIGQEREHYKRWC